MSLPQLKRPAGIPDSWPDHVKLMFDLQALALQADLMGAAACGVRNILTKTHGSTNPINLVKATIQGLLLLRTREEIARLRGVTL